MKIKLLIFSALIAVGLISCKLEGESNYTPSFDFIYYPRTQSGDSLEILYTGFAGVFRMDTISVGDTVSFYMYANAYSNNLSGIYITQSADSTTSLLLPNAASMDSIFSTASDYKTGKFILGVNSNSLYFPFKYIAKKASTSTKLTFTVVSDARFTDIGTGSNTNTFELNTPIKEKKDSTSTK